MNRVRFTRPPRLANLALIPGNLLPYKRQYQQLANELPKGNILIILPATDQRLRKAVETVASLLKADGHRVTTLPANRFT